MWLVPAGGAGGKGSHNAEMCASLLVRRYVVTGRWAFRSITHGTKAWWLGGRETGALSRYQHCGGNEASAITDGYIAISCAHQFPILAVTCHRAC